jgi:hypothetical protein
MIKVLERPTITLKELVIDYEDNIENYPADEYANDIGRYPYLQIGELVIQTTDTTKIVLYNNQFLPKIEVYFKDPTMKLIDPLFPLDDEIISVFIQSSSESLMPVRMDFKITNFNVVKAGEKGHNDISYVLTGILNVDTLYFQKFNSFQGTSFDVLKEISKESKLGFATNIDNTNDYMVWINPADTYLDFIQKIVNHSYSSDESFILSYVDFYYNLNYVDIEKSLNEDISEQQGMYFSSNLTKEKKEETTNLFLTDHPDKINTNLFIEKYNLLNSSTRVNLEIGYKKYVSYYDKNENKHYTFYMDTISTSGKDGDSVILKGKVGEVSEIEKNVYDGESLGRIDTDNSHKNYLYAGVQNRQNLKFLQKVKMKVTLNIMNFNLYRFQKLDIKFYKLKEIDDDKVAVQVNKDTINNPGVDYDEKKLNQRLSGEWLITGINYSFNKVGGFMQDITLVRRELGFNENDFDENNN